MPASRTLLVAGVATFLLAVSVASPSLAWITLGLDLLLVVASFLDHWRAARVGLDARRIWPPLLAQGAQATVEVRIRSSSRAVSVVAREALHPGLAEAPLKKRVEVPPKGEALWRYSLLPRRRGSHMVGPLTVRVLGPWALAWAQRDLLPSETRRVYPRVRWDARVFAFKEPVRNRTRCVPTRPAIRRRGFTGRPPLAKVASSPERMPGNAV